MSAVERSSVTSNAREESCDTRVWSGACEHNETVTGSDKYLCELCGVIVGLDHEVGHDGFPHITGDTRVLY